MTYRTAYYMNWIERELDKCEDILNDSGLSFFERNALTEYLMSLKGGKNE